MAVQGGKEPPPAGGWSGAVVYLVSGSATLLLGKVRRVQLWLLGALIVGVVVVFLIHWTAKKELHLENGAGEPETGDLP